MRDVLTTYTYLVWRPDDDETVDDARRVRGTSPEDAVETLASREYGGDSFDSCDYYVRREDLDEVVWLTVDADVEVTFSSYDNGPPPAVVSASKEQTP